MLQAAILPTMTTDSGELDRIEHTRLRRRMLYGQFRADLDARIEEQLGTVRQEAWGYPDLTGNPYLQLWTQTAVMYDADPVRTAPSALLEAVGTAALDPLMRRVQRDTLGLREMLLFVDVANGEVIYRPVFPDMVVAESLPYDPTRAASITEYRQEPRLGGAWVRDTWSILDPLAPFRRITLCDMTARDVTTDVLGTLPEGAGYVWRWADGTPFIPAVIYHAERTPYLFDPYTMREIVEGSLNIGVLLTYYGHIVRNAAWSQRVGIDVAPVGDNPAQSGERSEVVTDPATLLMLRTVESGTNPQVLTLSSPVDPEVVLRSIGAYERRILNLAGFTAPDVTRQNADIRSGYSLAVARESIRAQQARYESTFRPADVELMRKSAAVLNRLTGAAIDERDELYGISYRGLPMAPGEERAHIETIQARQAVGHLGPVSGYIEAHPGTSEEEAIAILASVATERLLVEQATARALTASGGMAPRPDPFAPEALNALSSVLERYTAGTLTPAATRALLLSGGMSAAMVDAVVGVTPSPNLPADAQSEVDEAVALLDGTGPREEDTTGAPEALVSVGDAAER
jgi:hypothetical protein